jgi:hypothetical protein
MTFRGSLPVPAGGSTVPVSCRELVALTGIEPEGLAVQLSLVESMSLSGRVFSAVSIPGCSETPPRTADVAAQSQPLYAEVRGRGGRHAFFHI